MKTTLFEIIEKSAQAGLNDQAGDGSMTPGHNGPYFNKETPVRNTAYWLITYTKAYELTGEKRYLNGVRKAVKYLLSKDARPYGKLFYCRYGKGIDKSNGLVGQAWVIDALSYAGRVLSIEKAVQLAENVFLSHNFSENSGLWYYHEINGKTIKVNLTVNQQIFFAASGLGLNNKVVFKQTKKFLDKLSDNFGVNSFGVVRHLITSRHNKCLFKNIRTFASDAYYSIDQVVNFRQNKEIGYHSFNLVGLAMLYDKYKNHFFWKTVVFNNTLKCLCSQYYITRLENNIYGYPYNVAGFEAALIIDTFLPNEFKLKKQFLRRQLKYFDTQTNLLEKNTKDPKTLAARICEVAKLSNLEVSI